MPQYERHLFACTNERADDDPRGCCQRRGMGPLLSVAKKALHAKGLRGKVRINKAGCLDMCAKGPVCVVYPEGVWYAPRTEADMLEIVERHLANGEIVTRLQLP